LEIPGTVVEEELGSISIDATVVSPRSCCSETISDNDVRGLAVDSSCLSHASFAWRGSSVEHELVQRKEAHLLLTGLSPRHPSPPPASSRTHHHVLPVSDSARRGYSLPVLLVLPWQPCIAVTIAAHDRESRARSGQRPTSCIQDLAACTPVSEHIEFA